MFLRGFSLRPSLLLPLPRFGRAYFSARSSSIVAIPRLEPVVALVLLSFGLGAAAVALPNENKLSKLTCFCAYFNTSFSRSRSEILRSFFGYILIQAAYVILIFFFLFCVFFI